MTGCCFNATVVVAILQQLNLTREVVKMSDVKQITNINWGVVGSVMVGMALLGATIYVVRRAPSNVVTKPLKSAASVATTR